MGNKPANRSEMDPTKPLDDQAKDDQSEQDETAETVRPLIGSVQEAEQERYDEEKALAADGDPENEDAAVEELHVPGTPGPMPARSRPAAADAKMVYGDDEDKDN